MLLCRWEILPTVVGLLAMLGGLSWGAHGVACVFEWQHLVVSPAERVAVFRNRTIRGQTEAVYPYEEVRLHVRPVEYGGSGRSSFWRGFGVVFDFGDQRFVLAQVASRQNAEEIANQAESDTGIPWEHSPEAISVAAMDVI